MGKQFKSHKTVEQIAKKHRLEVSFIEKQLKIGEPIEHEHTQDHNLARNIALQHLDEIPDYYTRLKKMEASAKKEHKKFKDVKEDVSIEDMFGNTFAEVIDLIKAEKLKESEEKRYCPLCDKKETRSECSYGEKAWDKVSIKDEEYSMARSELKTISDAVKRLQNKVGKGEGNLEAWVQSKITKAADYIDTAADYVASNEMEESVTVRKGILPLKNTQIKRSTGAGALSPEAAAELGDRAVELRKKKLAQTELPKIKKEQTESLVDKIISEEEEILNNKTSKIYEATRLQAETGNIIAVTLSWRGKYYSIRMFFPQTKLPNRNEINFEINKIYPGSKVIHHSVSELPSGNPLIRVGSGSYAKPGPSNNYVKPMGEEIELDEKIDVRKQSSKRKSLGRGSSIKDGSKPTGYESPREFRDAEVKLAPYQTRKEEVEISEAKKSEMKCNKPKAEAHGSGETGKSHVVKACEGGKEKLIRFGQLGVKGSPKKKGESKEYASRRHRFQTRHAKNISKGKMSAAYWANKVKW
jgi:hypothetical protein